MILAMGRIAAVEIAGTEVLFLPGSGIEGARRIPRARGLEAILADLRKESGGIDLVVTSSSLPISTRHQAAETVTCRWDGGELFGPLSEIETELEAISKAGWRCDRFVPWPVALALAARPAWDRGVAPEGAAILAIRERWCLVLRAGKAWELSLRQVARGAAAREIAEVAALPFKTWGPASEVVVVGPWDGDLAKALETAIGAKVRGIPTLTHPEYALALAAGSCTEDLRPAPYLSALQQSETMRSWQSFARRAAVGSAAVLTLSLGLAALWKHQASEARSVLASPRIEEVRHVSAVNDQLEKLLTSLAVPSKETSFGKALGDLGDAVPQGLWLDDVEFGREKGVSSFTARGRALGKTAVLKFLSQLEGTREWKNLSLRRATAEKGPRDASYVRFEIAGEKS